MCLRVVHRAGGDLQTYLSQRPNKQLPEKEAKTIVAQLFEGLAYLNRDHKVEGRGSNAASTNRIIHYDLKPANILFDDYGMVRPHPSVLASCMPHAVSRMPHVTHATHATCLVRGLSSTSSLPTCCLRTTAWCIRAPVCLRDACGMTVCKKFRTCHVACGMPHASCHCS